jgi:hypothetical protein
MGCSSLAKKKQTAAVFSNNPREIWPTEIWLKQNDPTEI